MTMNKKRFNKPKKKLEEAMDVSYKLGKEHGRKIILDWLEDWCFKVLRNDKSAISIPAILESIKNVKKGLEAKKT